MENKITVIDEIVKRHPTYGIEKGWSWYTGGMADTGDWYYRKMIDVPIGELEDFLKEIIRQESAEKQTPVSDIKEPWVKFTDESGNTFIAKESVLASMRKMMPKHFFKTP